MATARDRMDPVPGDKASASGAFTLRPARPADVGRIGEIERESFSNPWRPDTFRTLLERPRATLLVAEDSHGRIVGYAVFWWALDQGELANLAVLETHRGRGIGSALLEEVLVRAERQGLESLFLEVRVSNEAALRLYSKRGFSQISVRKSYYQNPREDARILVKRLSPSESDPRSNRETGGGEGGAGGDA